uniref:Uncharacterized protein n=1 Tax=Tetraselmis chuii TaxID=63592 RepID=A0A7S1T4N7_9CHLO|mmetsp:Transcript_5883/g.10596  ORF Transcript_5883/g.10596 Transcript_5883/m.10596 type:complete len:254 (+) Transcript_5883:283-1044(+)
MARRGSSLLFALAICCYFAVSTASSFSLPRVLRIFNGSPDTAPAKDLSTDDPKAEDLRMALHTLPRGVALSGPTPARVDTLTNPSIDDIVRIGKDIWNVVEENRGVIDYATDYSGAVPRAAVSDPFTMTGWKNQDVKGWRWQLINGYNSTVVDFTWAFKANTQGQYQGNGQFLNHVTTVVADVYAAWGFHVSVKAHADEPYNAGTLGAPVAVQELQVTMEVTTALNSRIDNCRVRFFGDGRDPQCIQCSTYAC